MKLAHQILNNDYDAKFTLEHANWDHLFWRSTSEVDSSSHPWIIWYILKARNKIIFENVDKDPLEVLRLAENDAKSWQLAQIEFHTENQG
ncbi:unnamed protein product [Arabidopsis halleri]